MRQQVNLFHPIFRKQEKKFSAKAMLQAAGLVVAGVIVLTVIELWQLRSLQNTLDRLDRQHANLSTRLAEFRRADIRADPLALKVVRMEQLLAARLKLREALKQDAFSNTRGYSEYFVAFSRQHIPGMWLTGFRIAGSGKEMTMQGRSNIPELVPRYIQKLSAEKSLAGIEFQIFQMARPQIEDTDRLAGYVEFVASTLGEEIERQP